MNKQRDDRVINNELGNNNEIIIANEEEQITKIKALDLFDTNKIREFEVSTFDELFKIHEYLFLDIYDFEGKIRKNISKGNFRFASTLYLQDVLAKIDIMLQDNFDDIIKKYVEMNVAHLFREWNGRGTHIWIDMM
jgi:cell filamentation protein